MCEVIITN